ncbi:26S protease regulatory subunit 10B [Fasciola gigantica]|uniref:26S protease regulatory subunit 10B n=1 Tax=Fasciola gigantica TaxID=46835 RepID=A0A504YIX0_FASGI|nr:26S protease regulatory subunit 10B [Fasciola gigantica]
MHDLKKVQYFLANTNFYISQERSKAVSKEYEKAEDGPQSSSECWSGYIRYCFMMFLKVVGDVLKQLTEDHFIVKASNGPRYVVGCRRSLQTSKLKAGTRVALDVTTLTNNAPAARAS